MDWENPLIKRGKLNSQVVQVTPIGWKGRLMLVETWRPHWKVRGNPGGIMSESATRRWMRS